jgi:hypothetical protein
MRANRKLVLTIALVIMLSVIVISDYLLYRRISPLDIVFLLTIPLVLFTLIYTRDSSET